jgi:DNA invertase Pin-like site-specific DNA recombinase
MRRGYARVSTTDQHLHVQTDRLLMANCDVLYTEQLSGLDDKRPELARCLAALTSGDILLVTRVDRLARSMGHLCTILTRIHAAEADLQVLDQPMDTRTPQGKALFGMLGVFAEFEAAIRKERQLEGIAKARQRGIHLGRKAALTPAQVYDLRRRRAQGQTIRQLMQHYGVGKTTVYYYLGKARTDEVLDAAD